MPKKYTIMDLHKYAKSKNGLCLSKKYTSCDHKYVWKCNKCKTQWEASWSQIKKDSWCPYCAGKKYDIEDMREIAKNRNGKCLSEEYLGVNFKLKWKCNVCGHIWENSPGHIINGNQWCVKCANDMESPRSN